MPDLRAQYGPLRQKFAALASFDAPVPEAELAVLGSLDGRTATFDATLMESERMLATSKSGMRNQLLSNLEAVEEHVVALRADSKGALPCHAIELKPTEALAIATKYKAACEDTRATLASMKDGLEVFGIEMPDPDDLKATEKEVELIEAIWGLLLEWEGD